jgi:hypothetical protein
MLTEKQVEEISDGNCTCYELNLLVSDWREFKSHNQTLENEIVLLKKIYNAYKITLLGTFDASYKEVDDYLNKCIEDYEESRKGKE